MSNSQPPVLPFSNDGSFMERFQRMQQAQQLLADAAGKAGQPSSTSANNAAAPPPPPPPAESSEPAGAAGSEQRQGGSTQLLPGEQPAAGQQLEGKNGDAGLPLAAAGEAASGAPGEPSGPSSGASQQQRPAPSMVLKSKKSIVQVRTRSGEALQPGSSKRAKKEEGGEGKPATGEQSFYLKEMQRYRQASCEGSTGDRPLVK